MKQDCVCDRGYIYIDVARERERESMCFLSHCLVGFRRSVSDLKTTAASSRKVSGVPCVCMLELIEFGGCVIGEEMTKCLALL